MPSARLPGCAAVPLIALLVGCSSGTPATVGLAVGPAVPATVLFHTGDGIPAPDERELPPGTRVTVLGAAASADRSRVRIEEGEYRGLEATVRGDAIRPVR